MRFQLPGNCKEPVVVDTLEVTCPGAFSFVTECLTGADLVSVNYTGTGTLVYSLSGNVPGWITIDPATGEISYNPTAGSTGNWIFNVDVTDGTLTDTCVHQVNIEENQPPEITNCPTSLMWEVGTPIPPYALQATDPEGQAVFWEAEGIFPIGVTRNINVIEGTPTQAGTGTLVIIARDACGKRTRCEVDWEVVDNTCCPTVEPIADFCFDHCLKAGNENGSACEKTWQIVIVEDSEECPNGGYDITVSPATDQITGNAATGTITLKSGWLEPGDYVVSYSAKAENGANCAGRQFTVKSICPTGVAQNGSFWTYWSVEKPYVDLMKHAALTRNNETQANAVSWPVDANNWPTEVGPNFEAYFYTNEQAVSTAGDYENFLRDTCYRVIWQGTGNVVVTGSLATGIINIGANEIQVTIPHNQIGNARVRWTNTIAGNHVRNVRIVPCQYANAYRNWDWDQFDCTNPANNPTIFNEDWLDKFKRSCGHRFMNSWGTSDWHTFDTNPSQDHMKFMLKPGDANFYDNRFSGFPFDPTKYGLRNYSMPPELVGYLGLLSPDTLLTLNFEGGTWDNLQAGDKYVEEFARRISNCGYCQPIKVEYGNEPWNENSVFGVFSSYLKAGGHPGYSGPFNLQTASRTYALKAADIIRAFKEGYCDPCKVIGVFNAQHYKEQWLIDALPYIDKECIHSIETGPYYSNDVALSNVPGANNTLYNAILSHIQSGQGDTVLFNNILDELKNSSWIGAGTSFPDKHDLENACHQMRVHAQLAHDAGCCYSFYEGGLHWNVFIRQQPSNDPWPFPWQMTGNDALVRDAVLRFLNSQQAADADQILYDCAKEVCAGKINVYAMMGADNLTIWSYWDRTWDVDTPRAALIKSWNDTNRELCTGESNTG